MKNHITKDGVSDAHLIRAARDMYEALELLFAEMHESGISEYRDYGWPKAIAASGAALAKARGEI